MVKNYFKCKVCGLVLESYKVEGGRPCVCGSTSYNPLTDDPVLVLYNELKCIKRTVKTDGKVIVYKTKDKYFKAKYNGEYFDVYTVSKGYEVVNLSKSINTTTEIFALLVGKKKVKANV